MIVGYRNGGLTATRSVPGPAEGLSLVAFDTNAPPLAVALIRGMVCRPLLALVLTSYDDNNIGDDIGEVDEGAVGSGSRGIDGDNGDGNNDVDCPKGTGGRSRIQFLSFDMTMDGALRSLASFASGRGGGDGGRARGDDDDDKRGRTGEGTDGGGGGGEGEGYASKFRSALSLWRDHAGDVWYARGGEFYGLPLPPPGRGDDYDNSGDVEDPPDRRLLDLGEKMAGLAPLSYRVSCMRSHGKRYGWRREDITPPLSDIFVPIESSPCHSVSHSGSGSGTRILG